ncbi:hypothetical protein [Streptomyces sp. TRM75561]|uniref:hypothetical protein n=1 Tax=Streptomyces sp. TRM75561 TaxID=2975269 RepID=UPI002446A740|nr:hypothetical protein [Streptomyces sp. TRM75561]MDH3039201.1 hypothetical protein [Streptomyces sp. TRM75561]
MFPEAVDVLLAARRVLRPRPAGHVQSTSPDTLDIRTGNRRLWLRFTTASSSAGQAPGDPAPGDRFGWPEVVRLSHLTKPTRAV